jgi:ADP-heptose:LPS heptosyltransferase
LGSLCKYFRLTEGDFKKNNAAFLKADTTRSAQIKKDLVGDSQVKLCGLSWRTSNRISGVKRNILLKDFIKALNLKNYTYISLQYGPTDEEIDAVKHELGVEIKKHKHIDVWDDLDGLASMIDICDVVITIDNSTAHLAGALGKDVRVLLPFAADWRWFLNDQESLWYPHMKLYRQNEEEDWEIQLREIRKDFID